MTTEEKLAQSIGVPVKIAQMDIGSHRVNYAVAGEGPPLLLIHGANFGWGVWYPNIPALAKHFTVYAIDLPGAGQSSRVDYKHLIPEKDFLEPVKEFVRIKDLTSFSVLGHSIGGWVALRLALENGDRIEKVILSDSVGFSRESGVIERVFMSQPMVGLLIKTILRPDRRNKGLEKFLRGGFSNPNVNLSPEFLDYFYENMARSHGLPLISRLISLAGVLAFGDEVKSFHGKSLIIWGDKDKILPLKKSLPYFRMLPGAKEVIIKNAGHVPSMERKDAFNDIVLNFILNGNG